MKGGAKQVLDQYLSDLQLPVIAMANASYWAKPEHYSMLMKSLKWIFFLGKSNSSHGSHSQFPALVIRYVIGIGSLSRENFELLGLLLC